MHGNTQPDGRPLGGSELRAYFSPFVDQHTELSLPVRKCPYSLQRRSCCVPEIFAIESRSCPKSLRNFNVLRPLNFAEGEGPPKFMTEFYKSGSPSNMWQSLVPIGQATSEIRRRKKVYTTAVKRNGRRPA